VVKGLNRPTENDQPGVLSSSGIITTCHPTRSMSDNSCGHCHQVYHPQATEPRKDLQGTLARLTSRRSRVKQEGERGAQSFTPSVTPVCQATPASVPTYPRQCAKRRPSVPPTLAHWGGKGAHFSWQVNRVCTTIDHPLVGPFGSVGQGEDPLVPSNLATG